MYLLYLLPFIPTDSVYFPLLFLYTFSNLPCIKILLFVGFLFLLLNFTNVGFLIPLNLLFCDSNGYFAYLLGFRVLFLLYPDTFAFAFFITPLFFTAIFTSSTVFAFNTASTILFASFTLSAFTTAFTAEFTAAFMPLVAFMPFTAAFIPFTVPYMPLVAFTSAFIPFTVPYMPLVAFTAAFMPFAFTAAFMPLVAFTAAFMPFAFTTAFAFTAALFTAAFILVRVAIVFFTFSPSFIIILLLLCPAFILSNRLLSIIFINALFCRSISLTVLFTVLSTALFTRFTSPFTCFTRFPTICFPLLFFTIVFTDLLGVFGMGCSF